MPNFKKSSRGFKMNRNSENPFKYGEGTGRKESRLKHDPEGYYASKEKEVAPKEASEKPGVNNGASEKPETTVPKKKSSKELLDKAMADSVGRKERWKKLGEEYDKNKPWSEKVGSWLNKYISY